MASEERFGIKREKGICAKEWGAKSRDNLIISQYTGSRT